MKRIPSLDGLRAISISLVVVGHWVELRSHSDVAGAFANLGVRIFFVISIFDYDVAAEGVRKDFDNWIAGILCAAGLSDSAGCNRVYGAGVCDFLA